MNSTPRSLLPAVPSSSLSFHFPPPLARSAHKYLSHAISALYINPRLALVKSRQLRPTSLCFRVLLFSLDCYTTNRARRAVTCLSGSVVLLCLACRFFSLQPSDLCLACANPLCISLLPLAFLPPLRTSRHCPMSPDIFSCAFLFIRDRGPVPSRTTLEPTCYLERL